MTRFTKAESTALAAGAAVTVLYVLGQMNRPSLSLVGGVILATLSLSACLLAVMGVRKSWRRVRDRQSLLWLCVALGIAAFFLAYVVGGLYLAYGLEVPLVSMVDFFFVFGYVLIFLGLLIQLWPFGELVSRKVVFGGTVFGFLLLLTFWLAIMPSHTGAVGLELAVAFLYPVLDIALLILSLSVVLIFRKGTFWRPLMFLVAGVILGLLGDLFSAYFTLALGHTYGPENLLLLFFDWANIMAALGFYVRYKQLSARLI